MGKIAIYSLGFLPVLLRAGAITYTYDDLDRLTEARYDAATAAEYAYDAAGNLQRHQVTRDSDGDGLPDTWEEHHFGSLTNANGSAQSDGDEDGLNDRKEFELGSDPTDAASGLNLVDIRIGVSSTVRRITWQSAGNRTYRVEASTNLNGAFQPLLSDISGTPPENSYLDGSTNRHRYYRVLWEGGP